MSISVCQGESVVGQYAETVEGTRNELALTNSAVYFEAEKPPSSIWLSGILLSLLQVVGIAIQYGVLRMSHVFARISLEQIDHLEVRRTPRSAIALLGGILSIVATIVMAVMADPRRGPEPIMVAVPWLTALGTIIVLILFPRGALVLGSHGVRYTYNSKMGVQRLSQVIQAISAAREQSLARPHRVVAVAKAAK